MLLLLRFLHFFENPKNVTFTFFCFASHVFSNFGGRLYAVLCALHEPGELSQSLCQFGSTLNVFPC